MKKTIIALVTLAGVASAATKATIDTTDSALESYFDYSTGNSKVAGDANTTWGEKMAWNSAGQYGTTGTQNSMYSSNVDINMKADGGFTFSFDINNITNTGTILTVFTGSGDAWRTLRANITKDDTSGAYTLSTTLGSATLTTELGTDISWTTLTFVGTANTAGVTEDSKLTMDLDIYVDGKSTTSLSDFGAWNFVVGDLNKVQFGYWGDSSKNTQLDIDNVLIYSRPLSADEVKALTVPEPTTATLSLLALAGLAARRRRK